MRQVTFSFDQEKMVHALAFFATRGIEDLTKLKAAKLLYFLDKQHLWEYGRPVVGGPYFCMPFGPVPGKALQVMNDVIDASQIDQSPFPAAAEDLIHSYLEVETRGRHARFIAPNGFDADVFSESELITLERVTEQYGHLPAGRLVDLTHKDPTWMNPNEHRAPGGRVPIPYHLFFEDAPPNVRGIWELIEAEQEDRETDEPLDPHTLASLAAAD